LQVLTVCATAEKRRAARLRLTGAAEAASKRWTTASLPRVVSIAFCKQTAVPL
jgi:hypothetical protein